MDLRILMSTNDGSLVSFQASIDDLPSTHQLMEKKNLRDENERVMSPEQMTTFQCGGLKDFLFSSLFGEIIHFD